MSVLIRSLTNGAPVIDNSPAAPPSDTFNLIPTANAFYDLYTAPISPSKRSAIIKGIRLLNTATGTTKVKVSLYFNHPTSVGQNRRRLLAPADIELPAGFAYIDEGELTLEPGDKIQAKADTANVVQYVISGIERDQT